MNTRFIFASLKHWETVTQPERERKGQPARRGGDRGEPREIEPHDR